MPGPHTWEQIETIVNRNLTGLQQDIERAADAETWVVTNAVAGEMAREFAHHSRTGASIRSIRTHVAGGLGVITMRGGGPYIERSTRAHGPIGYGNRVMKFWSNGILFYRRWVRGIQRDPFVERAMGTVNFVPAFERLSGSVFQAFTRGLERFK